MLWNLVSQILWLWLVLGSSLVLAARPRRTRMPGKGQFESLKGPETHPIPHTRNNEPNDLNILHFQSESVPDQSVIELLPSLIAYESNLEQTRRQKAFAKKAGKKPEVTVAKNISSIGNLFTHPHPTILNQWYISWHTLRGSSSKVRYLADIRQCLNSTYGIPIRTPALTQRYGAFRFPNKSAAYTVTIYPTEYEDTTLEEGHVTEERLLKAGFSDKGQHYAVAMKCMNHSSYLVYQFLQLQHIVSIGKASVKDCPSGRINILELNDLAASTEKIIVIIVDERLKRVQVQTKPDRLTLKYDSALPFDVQVDNIFENRRMMERREKVFHFHTNDVTSHARKAGEPIQGPLILRYTLAPVVTFVGDFVATLDMFKSTAYHIILSGVRIENPNQLNWFSDAIAQKVFKKNGTLTDVACLTKTGVDVTNYKFDDCHVFDSENKLDIDFQIQSLE